MQNHNTYHQALVELKAVHLSALQINPASPGCHINTDITTQQHPQQRCVATISSITDSIFSTSSFARPRICAWNSSQLMLPSLFVSNALKMFHAGLKPPRP